MFCWLWKIGFTTVQTASGTGIWNPEIVKVKTLTLVYGYRLKVTVLLADDIYYSFHHFLETIVRKHLQERK